MRMKCIQVVRIGSFIKTEMPVKAPSADEATIKVEVTGLCRTDLKLIRVGHRDLVLPRVPAEEVVGTVRQKGERVNGIEEGQRVYVYPGTWCGQCSSCLSGAENLCRDMQIMGFHRDGGFAEYVTVPAQCIIPVPDGLEAEEAVFAEPLSCCLNALELGGVGEGHKAAIWGAGPAGTLLARAAQALGANTTSIEPDPRRRALINGCETCPETGFDACFVAIGSKQAYQEAITRLNPRGRLVVFSGLAPTENCLEVNFNHLHYLEQTIVGAYGCCHRHGLQALEYIATGAVSVTDLISHRLSLWDLEPALDLAESRQGMKILLYP